MAKILIVGCGSIGYELAITLAEAGHEVTGLKRNIPNATDAPFNYVRADITSIDDLSLLDSDFEHIFFIVSAGSRDEKSYRDIYQTGIDNLIDRFSQTGCKAPWIFVSSTSVYGQNQGEWIDEDSPTVPETATSLKILQAEQKLKALNSDNIIIRFSGIYGPGREHLLRLAKRQPEIQKEPPYYTNRIHQQDCVGVLAYILECRLKGMPLQQCYLASDDAPAPLWDVMSWIADKMRCAPPIAKVVAHDIDMNKRCRNDLLKQLGYRFAYNDYKVGYEEAITSQTE